MASRFIVGIDLGTTNTALAYVDTGADAAAVRSFEVQQVVSAGAVEARPLLPSFLYLPGPGEQPAGAMKLPWDAQRDFAVGEFARAFGSQVPTRLVASAKSWLGHNGVDRKAAILPFRASDDGRKLSPLEACTRYLKHLAEAWNAANPLHPLEAQETVLTVPASFDASARDLTIEAARAAGLEHLTLLEEPQAAFYSWLDTQGDAWRSQVSVGDLVLVADVGGGTTDFTLIEVGEEAGTLALTRLAVGDHLLLGGDNMDLALAHNTAAALAKQGHKLDAPQMLQLVHGCRAAKEAMLADANKSSVPVTVLGKGRSVIGGSIQYDLPRSDVEAILLDGFFPQCERSAEPARNRAAGLQELGLPYAADAGITRHLAGFLNRQAMSIADGLAKADGGRRKAEKRGLPTAVLFNGGVFKSQSLQERFLRVLGSWGKDKVRALAGGDLDQAVAKGAAYYGLVRRGKGVRIRGGTARAYYIGVATSAPAVPGLPAPIKALCVAPFGMEEGTEADLPKTEFGLYIGEEAEFRFLGSTLRRDDSAGAVIEDWEGTMDELTPMNVTLESKGTSGVVPVHLHSKVTEIGQLELWCYSRDGKQKWKLAFNARM